MAKGKGFDYKTMVSNINASIASLQFNGYTYTNANIKAKLNGGDIISNGTIDDPAIKLNYDISGNVGGEFPSLEGFVRIDTIELKTLNLYSESCSAKNGCQCIN